MSKNGHIVVRLKIGKDNFEVLAKAGKVVPYREKKISLDNVLVAEVIFKNASRFQKVKNSDLKMAFGTDEIGLCLEKILQEGTFSLTKAEITAKVNEKKGRIIEYLHKYYFDPRPENPIPHPITRLEGILKEMRYSVDADKSVDQQIKDVVKKIPDFLPVTARNPPHLADTSLIMERRKDNVRKNKNKNGRKYNQRDWE